MKSLSSFFLALIFISTSSCSSSDKKETHKAKKAVYTVINVEAGDLKCYLTLKDMNNKEVYKNATFEICEMKDKVLNKKIIISQYKTVNVNDCESNEPCGKTKKEKLVAGINLE